MYLINGCASKALDVADRGLQYGDGVFETLEISNRHPVFLAQHLQRLSLGCQRLSLPCPDLAILLAEISQVCAYAPISGQAVLKLVLTRGVGGRGYRPPEHPAVTRILSLHPFPDYPQAHSQVGIAARICTTRLGLNPALAGIKHLNRLEQVLARLEWTDPAIAEGVMLDINGCVIEGTQSNLFYVKDGQLHTATLAYSGVAGIVRGLIFDRGSALGNPVHEHEFGVSTLLQADELFFCNSLAGVWPIKSIAGQAFPIGSVTQTLQRWFAEARAHSAGI